MSERAGQNELASRAAAGDRAALEELLLEEYPRLQRRLRSRIPAASAAVFSADDVIQEAFAEVFRCIAGFEPQGDGSFSRWVATIAERRLKDLLKGQYAQKRGGGRERLDAHKTSEDGSVLNLLELAAVHRQTPSRSAARHEAASAIHVALAGLKPEYREALELRYVQRLPVADIASKMNRTERAVHMLCNRGLKDLREAMGRATQFMTHKH